jgi:hypothetical protein
LPEQGWLKPDEVIIRQVAFKGIENDPFTGAATIRSIGVIHLGHTVISCPDPSL